MILESIRIAFRALTANKLRSALTMLGIIIGVGAVIALLALGRGLEFYIASQFEAMGTNLLFVFGDASGGQEGTRQRLTAGQLTNGDLEALRDPARAPDVLDVTAEVQGGAMVSTGRVNAMYAVSGVSPEYARVRHWEIEGGQFIDEAALNDFARVAVLGSAAADKLFPDDWPVGQTLKVQGLPFRVIGVLKSRGGSALGNEDEVILVPLTTAQQRLFNLRSPSGEWLVSLIYAQAASDKRTDAAVQEIGDVLRQRHRLEPTDKDDFQVLAQADVLKTMGQVTGALTLFLGAIAGISLLVGGIGIMNIMLVSVTERTREIGLRKAIGAKRRDILAQFLIEAVTLALIGGTCGLALGWLGATGISALSSEFPARVTADAVLMAFAFSAAVGLFFGSYPAWRAARLNPIEALRYE